MQDANVESWMRRTSDQLEQIRGILLRIADTLDPPPERKFPAEPFDQDALTVMTPALRARMHAEDAGNPPRT
jgi:hypothetical protein